MIEGLRILAVVPARGGSKGVPLKNLRPVLGEPIVARAGRLLAQIPEIDRRVVSTDHEEIARAAAQSGLADDFRRPPELSGDRIGDLDVLTHALETMEAHDGCRYDIVLMIQPTSPTRRIEHVRATFQKLVAEKLDSVWTLSATDFNYHPLKQLVVARNGEMTYYDPRGADVIARQELAPVYHRNGAAYAFTRACLLEQRHIKGAMAGAVITETLVDIDSLADFERAEAMLRERGDDV